MAVMEQDNHEQKGLLKILWMHKLYNHIFLMLDQNAIEQACKIIPSPSQMQSFPKW